MPIDFKLPVPKTLDEAIDRIFDSLDPNEIEMIKKYGAGSEHHGIGTAMRNRWGLWIGSDLKTHFMQAYGLGHADDMSGLILFGVEARVTGNPFDRKKEIQRYKDYWINMKLDPLTLQAIIPALEPEITA